MPITGCPMYLRNCLRKLRFKPAITPTVGCLVYMAKPSSMGTSVNSRVRSEPAARY